MTDIAEDTKALLNPSDAGEILLYDLGFAYEWEATVATGSDDAETFLSEDGRVRLMWLARDRMEFALVRYQEPMGDCIDGMLTSRGRLTRAAFRAVVRGFVTGA